MKKQLLRLISLCLLIPGSCFWAGRALAQNTAFKAVAFYSDHAESDHVRFADDALAFFRTLGSTHNFTLDQTSDWSNLNDAYLSNYQVVIWLNDVPKDKEQRAAFERYMEKGGAWLGFHAAGYTDQNTHWPWFVKFMGGAVFLRRNLPALPARLLVDKTDHPVTKRIPPAFASPANEWYQWQPGLRTNKDVEVLVSLDPGNYPLGMKEILTDGDTPVVWTNIRYHMLYMNMGHGDKIMSDYIQNHLIGDALLWLGQKK